MLRRVGSCLIAGVFAGAMVASCGGSTDDAGGSTAGESDQDGSVESADDAPASTLSEFCAQYEELEEEVPASYVGSTEHLADIDALRDAAPESIVEELTVFRDYLASGAIDSINDPESNLTQNWPTEVVAATSAIQAFGVDNC